jgi:hypothetical protein
VDETLVTDFHERQAVALVHPSNDGPRALADVFCKPFNRHKVGGKNVAHCTYPLKDSAGHKLHGDA